MTDTRNNGGEDAAIMLDAFDAVLADVQKHEATNTRNPYTDWKARQFFVDHGETLRAMLTARSPSSKEA